MRVVLNSIYGKMIYPIGCKSHQYDGMESLVYYKIGENNQLEEIEWEILNIQ